MSYGKRILLPSSPPQVSDILGILENMNSEGLITIRQMGIIRDLLREFTR